MASWIDFLQDKNGEIVYPVGITSGIFLPSGEKLSTWINEKDKVVKNFGETIIFTVETGNWEEHTNGHFFANAGSILPNSFKDCITLERPTIMQSSTPFAAEIPPIIRRKYTWYVLTDISNGLIGNREIEYVSNANKYVNDIIIDPDDPFTPILVATKRPPYKVCVAITNLSSS